VQLSLGSWASTARQRFAHRPLVAIAVLLVALLFPFVVAEGQWIRVGAVALIYVALASGLNLLVGMTGLLDLGYVAFFIVGAYTTSILSVKILGTNEMASVSVAQWIAIGTLPVAIAVAMAFGVVLGYPTLRARGDYLAIMTLAFGEIIRIVVINATPVTGGTAGIREISPLGLLGEEFVKPTSVYYTVLAVVAVLLLVITLIVASSIGRAWVAVREDELVAQSVGIRTRRYKLLAYVCGASIASVAGVVFAHMQQFINPDNFTLEDNFIILSLVIVGGAGTFWGPVVGAVVWIFLSNWSRDQPIVQSHPEIQPAVLALVVILVLILRPAGLVSSKAKLSRTMPKAAACSRDTAVSVDTGMATDTNGAVGSVLKPPTVAGQHLLECRNLTKSFGGVCAIDDASFHVDQGEIVGLIGPNGAGKSTLLNVISGVIPPSSGTVTVGGACVTGKDAAAVNAHGIARTFQNVRLFGRMTVSENLLVGAHRRVAAGVGQTMLRSPGFRRREQAAMNDVNQILRFVRLDEFRDREAATLAYGYQRRLEIARALMTNPSLLLLDEPAAGMNESESRDLAQLVNEIRQAGIAVVIIEHDMDILMSVSDRVVVLNYGKVIADGTPDDVRSDSGVIEAYLGQEQR
jgi:branched-chain amino acid transport system permease protein